MMKPLLCLLACLAACSGFADRLIITPTATRPSAGTLKLESLLSKGEASRWFLEGSLGTNWEAGVQLYGGKPTFGISYSYLLPIIDLTPGITVGALDLLDETPERRAAYLAFTFNLGNLGDLNQDVPTEFTLGFWTRTGGTFFAGTSLPFHRSVRLVAEWDSFLLRGGLELRPFKEGVFRALTSERGPAFSFSLASRF
jgi:hypothetical protein